MHLFYFHHEWLNLVTNVVGIFSQRCVGHTTGPRELQNFPNNPTPTGSTYGFCLRTKPWPDAVGPGLRLVNFLAHNSPTRHPVNPFRRQSARRCSITGISLRHPLQDLPWELQWYITCPQAASPPVVPVLMHRELLYSVTSTCDNPLGWLIAHRELLYSVTGWLQFFEHMKRLPFFNHELIL